jgi:hypothetical protein
MPTYRYANPFGKPLRRCTVVEQPMGVRPDGTPLIIAQAGAPVLIPSGTLLTDVQPFELEAFGDQLTEVSETEMQAMHAAGVQEGVTYPIYSLAGVHQPSGLSPEEEAAAAPPEETGPQPEAAPQTEAPATEESPGPTVPRRHR